MRAAWCVAFLLIPSAAAELVWEAPDEGRVGHPIRAAWMDVASADPFVLNTHVEAAVAIYESDRLVFQSQDTHEHDGLHMLQYTPTSAGNVRLEVTTGGGTASHEILVEPRGERASGAASDWEMLRLAASDDGWIGEEGWLEEGTSHWERGTGWTARDDDGRLVWQVYQVGPLLPGNMWYDRDGGAVRTTITPTPSTEGGDFGMQALALDVEARDGPPLERLLSVVNQPLCDDLILDPNSLLEPLQAFEPWTSIRVVKPGEGPVGGGGDWVAWSLWAADGTEVFQLSVWDDPWRMISFTTPGPGLYHLAFDGFQEFCILPILVLPFDLTSNPAPGTLEATIDVAGDEAMITMQAISASGAPLTHYEFDTQVFREHPDEGRIAWSGKLHGHDGDVMFQVGGLEPGTWNVVTYPSPQNQGVAPVATDNPEGFHWTFEIPASAGGGDSDDDRSTPVPIVAALAALAVAVFLRRR